MQRLVTEMDFKAWFERNATRAVTVMIRNVCIYLCLWENMKFKEIIYVCRGDLQAGVREICEECEDEDECLCVVM